MTRSTRFTLQCLVMSALLTLFVSAHAKPYGAIEQQRINQTFPQHDAVSAPEGKFNVRTITQANTPIGYVFQSLDVVAIPAYSGKPINTQVILDTAGIIRDAYVLEHHEPILLIGIPEVKLHDFTSHYAGVDVRQRGGQIYLKSLSATPWPGSDGKVHFQSKFAGGWRAEYG